MCWEGTKTINIHEDITRGEYGRKDRRFLLMELTLYGEIRHTRLFGEVYHQIAGDNKQRYMAKNAT